MSAINQHMKNVKIATPGSNKKNKAKVIPPIEKMSCTNHQMVYHAFKEDLHTKDLCTVELQLPAGVDSTQATKLNFDLAQDKRPRLKIIYYDTKAILLQPRTSVPRRL